MARPVRIEYDGALYHVTSRGNDRRKIYYGKTDYEGFRGYLREAQEKYGFLLHCYVLMSNHYHLIIETPRGNLSQVMHHINGSYAGYINRKRRRIGHLFQGRYKAILVDGDSYLLELSRYIHLNPVRAKMVSNPADYPHSSYRAYVSKAESDIVYRDLIYGMICEDPEVAASGYRDFVEGAPVEDLDNPLKQVYGGMILGGQKFIKEALGKVKEEVFDLEEISHRRDLRTASRVDEVITALSEHLRMAADELFLSDDHKKLILYVLKKYTGLTNRQIGQMCGDISYSAVAKAHQRFSDELVKDKSLKKEVQRIATRLSNVKG